MAARNDFDDFFGDEDVPVTDTRADGRLYRVPLTRLSPNLVNPRKDFGTEDALIDFGKSLQRRQNQACPVVSRNAYLKLWPDHRDQVKDVDYILVSGERRYRAACAVGLAVLDCVVNDDFAKDRKTFMEAVVSENVDRRNFDAVEEAYAVQALVTEFGSNRAVAQHFERVDGWVTQRLLLTHLAPQMQDLVRTKTMPLEAARTLGKQARDGDWSADDQAAWWTQWKAGQTAAADARKAAKREAKKKTPKPTPAPPTAPAETEAPTEKKAPAEPKSLPEEREETGASFTAVKQPGPPEEAGPPSQRDQEDRSGPPEKVPEPRADAAPPGGQPAIPEDRQPPRLPYDDGRFLGDHLALKMVNEPYFLMLSVLLEKGQEKDPQALARVLARVTASGA